MTTLIRNRRIADDGWRLLDADALLAPGEDGFVPEIPAGDVMAPLKLWRRRRDELTERPGRTRRAARGPRRAGGDRARTSRGSR